MMMYVFTIPCKKGNYEYPGFVPNAKPDKTIRVTKLRTNVTKSDTTFITGIYINHIQQMMGEIDAYYFSTTHADEVRKQFLIEYGLQDKSDKEIDDFLDENEISVPDLGRLDLGTFEKGSTISISGKFEEVFSIAFIGVGYP